MFFCFKRKFHILSGIVAIATFYFVLQILFFAYYDHNMNGGQQGASYKGGFVNPKFNVLIDKIARQSSGKPTPSFSMQTVKNIKKKAQFQIPFKSDSDSAAPFHRPKLVYLLPYNLQRTHFNLTTLFVDYMDFNNFETTQTSLFIRGVNKEKANLYLPNAKGTFSCLNSNVSKFLRLDFQQRSIKYRICFEIVLYKH